MPIKPVLTRPCPQIDAHPQYIFSQTTNNDSSLSTHDLLSATELAYLKQHLALLANHYNASFLSSFPPKLRRLDDRAGAGGVSMVEGPDLDKAVWIRCLGVAQASGSNGRRPRAYDAEDDLYDDGKVVMDKDDEDNMRNGDAWGPVEISCGFISASNNEDDEGGARGASQGYGSTQRTQRSGDGAGGERVATMRRGEIWLVRWSSVRDAVFRGECELV